jgi:hypothetical protein
LFFFFLLSLSDIKKQEKFLNDCLVPTNMAVSEEKAQEVAQQIVAGTMGIMNALGVNMNRSNVGELEDRRAEGSRRNPAGDCKVS